MWGGTEYPWGKDLPPQTGTLGLPRQILLYAPALLIPGLLNFVALALYTRLLSPEAYGRYAFALAVVVFVKIVGFGWLSLGMSCFFQGAHRDGRLSVLLSTAMAGFLIISLFNIVRMGRCSKHDIRREGTSVCLVARSTSVVGLVTI